MLFSKIMVPLDGSTISLAALEPARSLARQGAAELVLVRVPGLPDEADASLVFPIPAESLAREQSRCEKALIRLADELRETGYAVSWKVLEQSGDPADSLLLAANQLAIDLIVMTSHSRRGLRRILLGSVAEKLARQSPCPVLIVGQHTALVAQVQQKMAEENQGLKFRPE